MPRITKYEEWKNEGTLDDKLLLVKAWARDGLTQQQIADNLGINICVLIDYKKKYPQFLEALKINKEMADYEVENALYKRAIGYKYVEVTKELVKNKVTDEYELKVTKEITREVPPDTTAQIYWLKNRKKEQWRDKQEVNLNTSPIEDLTPLAELLKGEKK